MKKIVTIYGSIQLVFVSILLIIVGNRRMNPEITDILIIFVGILMLVLLFLFIMAVFKNIKEISKENK